MRKVVRIVIQTMKVNEISDSKMQTLFNAIITGLTQTGEYIPSAEMNNWWFSFKYLRNNSKQVLPYLQAAVEHTTSDSLVNLGTTIALENDERWGRLAKIYYASYDALKDYNITETYTGSLESNLNEKFNSKSNDTGSRTDSEKVYGFNSVNPVNARDTSSSTSEQRLSTEADNNRNQTNAEVDNHTITRSGNNRPIPELYDKEWVARKNNLIDLILTDISYYLCINVY